MDSDNESVSSTEANYQHSFLNVSKLPVNVKNRVKALKKLQFATINAEAEYYKEVHALDVKYQKMFDAINIQRAKVVKGVHEPTGDEIDWPSDQEDEDGGENEEDSAIDEMEKLALKDFDENSKGIPKFWSYALKHANEEALMGLIESHDEPILDFLEDITVSLHEPKNTGFTLNFHFAPNGYFSNTVLTKEYELRDGPDPENPLAYDGPEIYKCKGCKIDWMEGKDVTQTKIKEKKIKTRKGAKGSPQKTREVKADSFFNFFSPPDVPEDPEANLSDEDKAVLAVDFDVGFAIKEKMISRAVLYFTGDIFDDDDFEDCETEDENDDDEEEEEDGEK